MLRATSIVRRPAVKAERVADTLTLDHSARHRRRLAMTGEGGLAFLLDLDKAAVIEDGDALKLEDGRLVRVAAAPERLIEVRTGNPLRLMRVAWHLGNRHVATEIEADALYLAHDHVLLEMVRGLGVEAREVTRPFRPERGAYDDAHAGHDHAGHGHDHGGHGHDHAAHGHEHGAHDRDHHHHADGAACGCGHDHGPHHTHEDHVHAPAAHGHHGHAADHSHDHAPGHHQHSHG